MVNIEISKTLRLDAYNFLLGDATLVRTFFGCPRIFEVIGCLRSCNSHNCLSIPSRQSFWHSMLLLIWIYAVCFLTSILDMFWTTTNTHLCEWMNCVNYNYAWTCKCLAELWMLFLFLFFCLGRVAIEIIKIKQTFPSTFPIKTDKKYLNWFTILVTYSH